MTTLLERVNVSQRGGLIRSTVLLLEVVQAENIRSIARKLRRWGLLSKASLEVPLNENKPAYLGRIDLNLGSSSWLVITIST